jgi:hypothetical protein
MTVAAARVGAMSTTRYWLNTRPTDSNQPTTASVDDRLELGRSPAAERAPTRQR